MNRMNKKEDKKGNRLLSLAYIAAVVVMMLFIVYFIICDKQEEAAYELLVEELVIEENADGSTAEDETSDDVSGTTETEAETAAAAETTAEAAEAAADYSITIVVLNGTTTDGVAGYWASVIQGLGYTDVTAANYGLLSDSETVIVASSADAAEPLLSVFPDATVQVGTSVEGEVWISDGEEVPQDVDVYVIVGMNDAVTG